MRANKTNLSTARDRGVGLVEVIVAVVLLGIVTSAVLAIVLQSQASTVNNRSRVAASNLAAREIDYVRELFSVPDTGPLDVANAGTVINPHSFGAAGTPLVVDGKPYTVKRSTAWNVSGSGASACEGGSLVKHPTLNVRVEVTWPNMGQTKPVVNTTNLAPPKGTGLPTTNSYIAVKVTNAQGKPNPGRSVTVKRSSGGSEIRSGTTDESGCAVVQVAPATGLGSEYAVQLGDAGHVDMSGVNAPTKVVGRVKQGELNSSVDMTYDRAASLEITFVGGGVMDADIAGSTVNLYNSQSTGSNPVTPYPVSGVKTTITGLWPTKYSAFLGAIKPDTSMVVDLPAGGTGRLDVPISVGTLQISGAPAGATILAAPSGAANCTAPGAREVDPAVTSLIPGNWAFFARSPAFGCSPGPGATAVHAGENGQLVWETSTLAITNAPTGAGPLWAVSNANVTATCTVPANASEAILFGEAPTATGALPAGNWYIFATPAGSGGPASGQPCVSTGLVNVPYGKTTTFAWTGTP